MENLIFNKYQSSLEELQVESFPQEVQDQFFDFINNVPFIKHLISKDRLYAKDLPRDEEGKIIVDLTKPHILENMDYFRPSAIHYQKYGCYTKLRPNSNPNSDYGKWVREEIRRCYDGYIRQSDGEWITGDMYFFLNYCPIQLTKKDTKNNNKTIRVVDFPKVWEGHYFVFHYLNKARNTGKHAVELASRGKGKSFLGASLLAKRFILGESQSVNKKVQCVVTASERKYIQGANQILDMFQYYIDFCAQNTQYPSKRLTSSLQNMQWTMGYIDLDTGSRNGTENSVTGITSKDDESKLRGSRGVLYLLEEMGTFPRLLKLYSVLRPSVEDGKDVWGIIFAYGCCMAGTELYNEYGKPINIEDTVLNQTILGYQGLKSSEETITWKQPIGYKECVRINTEKANYIECSTDHPLLVLNKDKFGKSLGTCTFKRASELSIGDTLLRPRTIGKFGNIREPNAYLLGALFGDGSYSNNSCPTLSISTEEEYEYYNNKYDIGISKLSKGNNTYAQIYFRGLLPLLKKYKMWGQSFERKQLPYNIFEWDKESICEFLGGYFNADGNVQIVKNNHRSIKLTCKYKKPLTEVKALLLKLGISAHIYKENKPERIIQSNVNQKTYNILPSSCYVLYISNSADIITFRENIKLLVKSKQDRLDSYNKHCYKGFYDNLIFEVSDNGKGELLKGKVFSNLQGVTVKSIESLGVNKIYNLTANTTHTYISNGFISANTSGDSESDFAGAQELMYNPQGYNMLELPNVYDKEGQGRKYFTLFFGGYLNRAECYNNDGVSNVTRAILEILEDRFKVKYNSTDINAITKRIAEIPITPQEAILRTKGNIFPVTDLNARLNELDNNTKEYHDVYIGNLVFDKDEVKFVPTTDLPIRDFPLKDNKAEGAIEIFKLPEKDAKGKVFQNRYIIGHDPVDSDEADTMSLSSTFVLDLWTDQIVCEYTGRKSLAEDNYEIVRKLCYFYNAKCLYENNLKGLFAYMQRMRCLHLLADTPEYLKDKDLIKSIGQNNKSKGVNATAPINNYANTLIRDWLIKPITQIEVIDGEEVESTTLNLYKVRNRALIKELILYNPDINVDRIRALGMLMLYREEKMIMYQGDLRKSNNVIADDYLGNDPFFSNNYASKF